MSEEIIQQGEEAQERNKQKRGGLNEQQRRFCDALLDDPNGDARKAYVLAGYKKSSMIDAQIEALMAEPRIQHYLKKREGSFSIRERAELLSRQNKVLEFMEKILYDDAYNGEKIRLKHRVDIAKLYSQCCGLTERFKVRSLQIKSKSVRFNSNTQNNNTQNNVTADNGVVEIKVVDPYAQAGESADVVDAEYQVTGEADVEDGG